MLLKEILLLAPILVLRFRMPPYSTVFRAVPPWLSLSGWKSAAVAWIRERVSSFRTSWP